MGNCQAIDAAAMVIQHPSGREERLYWSVTAIEVMRMNPGHFVSLIIPNLPPNNGSHCNNQLDPHHNKNLHFTVKLLRPTDTLALGHAYRLLTTQEVTKVLRAKQQVKEKQQTKSNLRKDFHSQVTNLERRRPRTPSTNYASMRPKPWRPSLHSISEAAGCYNLMSDN